MGLAGEIAFYFGYGGAIVLGISSLIGLWLLNGGYEWCRMEWRFLKSAWMMPGPPALPLIGNALHFACSYNELLPQLLKLADQYDSPLRFWLGPKLVVAVINPNDIGLVLNSPIATHKPHEYRFVASYMGLGIATDSGPRHRAQRKLVLPMVNGKALNGFVDCFDRHSRRCVECLEERVDTGEFEIMHYMDDYTLDVILETVMGTVGTAQHGGYKGLMTCSARAFGLCYERTFKPWLHWDWIYARTKDGQQYASDLKILHNFTDTLIRKKREEYHASELQSDLQDSSMTPVLNRLTARNEETKLMDDKRLRDEITNIWMPAQDPTALTSSFLFMMLGMHPQVQDKVRAEVQAVVGDGDITLEQISKLKYLEMVFRETVRLFPVGPVILRELQDDLKFESCSAPKGCTIALGVFRTHRDPRYWTEPEKFNPDRFTPENSAGRHPYAFVPFSGGIRGCIGQQYATMLMKILVARVIQKYRIHSEGSLETLRLKAGVSIRAMDGYKVSITRL